jgi:hypothetical protein
MDARSHFSVDWKSALLLQHSRVFQKALYCHYGATYFVVVDAVMDVLPVPLCIHKACDAQDAEVL